MAHATIYRSSKKMECELKV